MLTHQLRPAQLLFGTQLIGCAEQKHTRIQIGYPETQKPIPYGMGYALLLLMKTYFTLLYCLQIRHRI